MTRNPKLEGRKILVTGPAGQIAFPMARALARANDVWGIARFSDPASRKEVEDAGIRTLVVDLEEPDFSELPRDFDFLLHLAATVRGDDYDGSIRVNAEGTGLLLSHCRDVEAALVMSTVSVYKPHPDPWHAFTEGDPLGDILLPFAPAYSVSKIAEEGVARFCAREFGIPITIARMGASYGPRGGLPIFAIQALLNSGKVTTRFDPCPYSPIHDDDMLAHVAPLLGAASVPATIVNWAGDEAVSLQDLVAYGAELLGIEARVEVVPVPGASIGSVADPTRRRAITGPCRVAWRDGLRRALEALYPDRVREAAAGRERPRS
jgi:nucleoside-diphosphate-sugar epimerase